MCAVNYPNRCLIKQRMVSLGDEMSFSDVERLGYLISKSHLLQNANDKKPT